MAIDPDRDLINRIDSAISEEIQNTLEKVVEVKLKPILESLVKGQQELLKQQEITEKRLNALEKEQKRQGKAIKKLQKTLDFALKVFNKEDMRLYKRIRGVEDHLGLPRFE